MEQKVNAHSFINKSTDNSPHWLLKSKTAQLILALFCFLSPIIFLPTALHESGTGLWVHAGLSKSIVRRVLLPGGIIPVCYALLANKGVYRSTDNGITWLALNSGLPSEQLVNINVEALAVDAGNPSIAYAGMGGAGSRDSSLSAGLYVLDETGATWLPVGREMAGQEVRVITIMPSVDKVSVVCAAASEGIYCNTGEGRSWVRLGSPAIEPYKVLSLAIRPGNPRVIYVGTDGHGLYVTEDRGDSWKEMNQGLVSLRIYDIAISRAQPHLMYVATDNGLYKSTDAGSNWVKLGLATNGRRINTIAWYPENEDVLFVGLQYGAAYYTTDGGTHWIPLKKGLGDVTILWLALDPQNPSILWAGTTGGIWRYVLGMSLSPTGTHLITRATPEPTPTLMAQPSATPTTTPSLTPTSTPTPTPTTTLTASPTATYTRRPSPTRILTPTPTITATPSPSLPPSPPTRPPPPPTETLVLR